MKKKYKKISEDAIVAGGSSAGGDIQQTGNTDATSTLNAGFKPHGASSSNVLGKCDHAKDGYMGAGCFHMPSRVKTPMRRWDIGKKRKNAYAQGMKTVANLLEGNAARFSKAAVNSRLKDIASNVKSMKDAEAAYCKFKQESGAVAAKFKDGKYSKVKQLFLDFGAFIKDVVTGKHKTSWFTISMVVVALIYVLSPVDIIPDVIPIVGLVDDAFVITLVYNAIKDEFEAWRLDRS